MGPVVIHCGLRSRMLTSVYEVNQLLSSGSMKAEFLPHPVESHPAVSSGRMPPAVYLALNRRRHPYAVISAFSTSQALVISSMDYNPKILTRVVPLIPSMSVVLARGSKVDLTTRVYQIGILASAFVAAVVLVTFACRSQLGLGFIRNSAVTLRGLVMVNGALTGIRSDNGSLLRRIASGRPSVRFL